jgi:hypothetical protein
MIDKRLLCVLFPALLLGTGIAVSQERDGTRERVQEKEKAEDAAIFSGPQKGEKLLPFKVTGVYDKLAGKELDWVTEAGERPIFFVFVHKLTRPSFGLTKQLTAWAGDRPKDKDGKEKLVTRIIWLDDDKSKAQEYLTRARKSLGVTVPIGVSVNGGEGPGAYGLNRNVTLTILVGVKGKVTANFALVQPSDTEAPKILAEVAAVIGEKAPTKKDLAKYGRSYARAGKMRQQMARTDPTLRRLVTSLRPKDLTDESAEKVVAEIEKYVEKDRKKMRDLGIIATVISSVRNFATSGTEGTRKKIQEWAKKYGGRGARQRAGRPERPSGNAERKDNSELVAAFRLVIGKDLTPEEVDQAAARAEKYIEEHEESADELVRIARIVIEKGHGTDRAREHFAKWVKKYAKKAEDKPQRGEGKNRGEKKRDEKKKVERQD